MPEKLDRCVQQLIDEGYNESEAWAICKKALEATLQLDYTVNKKITTGQFISDGDIVDVLSQFNIQIKDNNGEKIGFTTILNELKKIKKE